MTVPAIPVEAYGGTLLTEVGAALVLVLPYAAAITAFAIGVGMFRRWLGHRSATSLGGPDYYTRDYDAEAESGDPDVQVWRGGRLSTRPRFKARG